MSEHEPDDWHGEWAQGRISDLKDRLTDDDLDDRNDENGYYDDSDEDSRALYAIVPTWWENLWVRVAWRWRWFIPLTALLIPFLLLIGGLAVLATLSGDDSGSPLDTGGVATLPDTPIQAEWPPGVSFADHTIPAMIRDDLALVGAMRGYRFTGAMGDTWRIEVEPRAGSALDPMIRIYAPDGHELAMNDNRAVGDPSAEVIAILPQDGAFRLVVQAGGDGLTTGEYWLMVSEE